MRLCMFLAFIVFAGTGVARAQHSPYAGYTAREIKALSADEIEGYLEGEGMGFALVAELNHHPGPKHVLDLADELSLTADQRRQTESIFADMHERTTALGRQLVDAERRLDELFAQGSAKDAEVRELITKIGGLEADIRFAHVDAHLKMTTVLTTEQIARYDALRGYAHHHKGHGH
jgi:Spy/CpxP family protein refolding chaperone